MPANVDVVRSFGAAWERGDLRGTADVHPEIEFYVENEPDFRHASMDVFVSEDHQRRGLGTDALLTLARYLIDERGSA